MQYATVQKKRARLRHRLKEKQKAGRPRLSIHRTNKHMYAQVIDDDKGITVVSASSKDKDFPKSTGRGCDVEAAHEVGKMLAVRAIKSGIKQVYFDRSSFKYHGRVKSLAESARVAGLEF